MPTESHFDPTAELPGPPTPWASTSQPSHRSGPPYHMTEMIAAEPRLAERILGHDPAASGSQALAAAVREVAQRGEPIVVTGCGTSEHGAQGVAEILRDALEATGFGSATVHTDQAFVECQRPLLREFHYHTTWSLLRVASGELVIA